MAGVSARGNDGRTGHGLIPGRKYVEMHVRLWFR